MKITNFIISEFAQYFFSMPAKIVNQAARYFYIKDL